MKFCTSCGAQIGENVHYCPLCGTDQETQTQQNTDYESQRDKNDQQYQQNNQAPVIAQKKKTSKKLLIGIAAAVVVAVAAAIVLVILLTPPSIEDMLTENSWIYSYEESCYIIKLYDDGSYIEEQFGDCGYYKTEGRWKLDNNKTIELDCADYTQTFVWEKEWSISSNNLKFNDWVYLPIN